MIFRHIVKYFQKIQIVQNLKKLNIDFGDNTQAFFINLESISIPIKKLMTKYLKWGKFIEGDRASMAMKGSNGKLTRFPEDVFMLSSLNWVPSFILVSAWICSTLADLYADEDDWLKVGTNFVAALAIDLTYYHFLLVSFSEISTSKFERKTYREILARKLSLADVSIYFAVAFVIFISYDLIKTISLVIEISTRKYKNLTLTQQEMMIDKLRYDQKLLLNKFTHGLDQNRKVDGSLLTIYSTLRYLFIQICISTLQDMERLQSSVILLIQVIYAVKLFKDLGSKGKTFDSKLNTWKHIIQEASLIIVFFFFTIFAFRQKNEKFMESGLHSFMEFLCLLFLSVFIVCEFIMIFYGGYNTTVFFIQKYKGTLRKPGAGSVRLSNRAPNDDEGVFIKDLEDEVRNRRDGSFEEKTKTPFDGSFEKEYGDNSIKVNKIADNDDDQPIKKRDTTNLVLPGEAGHRENRLMNSDRRKLKVGKGGFMKRPSISGRVGAGVPKILFFNKN